MHVRRQGAIADFTLDKNCWNTGKQFSDKGAVPSLVGGANIAGFKKVADAMREQGDWW